MAEQTDPYKLAHINTVGNYDTAHVTLVCGHDCLDVEKRYKAIPKQLLIDICDACLNKLKQEGALWPV